MREILFKGKSKDNVEWVQGYIYKIWGSAFILWGMVNEVPYMIEVDPETICQYTGLRDKNGNKIFEGDILKYSSEIFYVNYNERFATFECKHYNNMRNTPSITPITCGRMEVIGNIFDNHELLEGSEA